MEASGTPQPAAPPPPTPPPAAPQPESAGVGRRILAVIGGLILGFVGVALLVRGFDVVGAPLCGDPEDVAQAILEGETECYEGSSTQRFFDALFSFPGGVLGIAALVLSVYFAATGKRGKLLLQIGIASLVLLGAALLVSA
jgi:hypothetical protein